MNIDELIQRIAQAAADMQVGSIGDDPMERLATEAHLGRYILENHAAIVHLLRDYMAVTLENQRHRFRNYPNNPDLPG